jgi:hypothetical protein
VRLLNQHRSFTAFQEEYLVSTNVNEKHEKTIADYFTDLVALEEHIEQALDHQLELTKDDSDAAPLVRDFHTMVNAHIAALKPLHPEQESGLAGTVKSAAAAVVGRAAGLIDMVRTEGVSKALRDDYTSFNFAAISYSMFYATASGLGNKQLAEVAEKHLTNYAAAIQKINHVIARVVLNELKKDGHDVDFSATSKTTARIDQAWKVTSN